MRLRQKSAKDLLRALNQSMINFNAMWTWVDQNSIFYFCLVGGLITLALIMAIIPLLRDQGEAKRSHDWIWGILIVAILAAGRWPSIFFPRELNPDEGQLLAGARVLLHDPVFWRSVDGGTAGPMDYFPLLPAGWLFGWNTYFTARITAFTLLAITLVFAHQCMALVFGRRVARATILPTVCFGALTNGTDFLHYSTEMMPMTMVIVAAYAAIRRWIDQSGPLWNGLGGLLLGAVPLAKLQAVPLAAALGLVWLLTEIFSKEPSASRRITFLLVGALLPVTLFACQLTIAGEWDNVIIPYLLSNIQYSDEGSSLGPTLQIMMAKSSLSDTLLHQWLPGVTIWLVLMLRLRRSPDRAIQISLIAGFAAVLLALLCIRYPGRPYLHYWQLAIVPLTFFVGAMTANLLSSSKPAWRQWDRWLVVVCAFGLVGTLLIHRAGKPCYFLGYRAFFQQYPHTDLSSRIIPHVRPGETLANWGWSHFVYVETGLLQATRDGNVARSLEYGPHRDYYRHRYLVDLLNAMPTYFLDSIGPASLFYTAPQFSHDQSFPALAAVIRDKYVLIEQMPEGRLYRRRDSVPH